LIDEFVNPFIDRSRDLSRAFQHFFAGRKWIAVAEGGVWRLVVHGSVPAKAGQHSNIA
jgi:hypothetical protein